MDLLIVLAQTGSDSITLGGNKISFQPSVKYLGVKLDQTLSMEDHISSVCHACFLQLRRISSVRPFLSKDAVVKLVTSTVISRLDYCNSTLAAISSDQIARLQRVQNCAACLVLQKRKRDHVTPLLRELHWLPVIARCQYKVAVLAYRHFDGSLAPYLSSTIKERKPNRTLRSSEQKFLDTQKIPNLKSVGERVFSFVAPTLWNSLPMSLRHSSSLSIFKSDLKTYLFKQHLSE